MAYAQASDVETELGRPASSSAETDQWDAWLDRVERSIERAFRRSGLVLADQIDLGDPTEQDVIDIEVGAVIRKIQNPVWGRTSSTRSIDDAQVTDRAESDPTGDPLALTLDDLNALLPAGDAAAFSTRPGFEPDTVTEDTWV